MKEPNWLPTLWNRHMEDAMKNREGARYLGPESLALLQECFDTLLARNDLNRDSEDANIIAATLIEAFGRGVSDRLELIRLADIWPAARRTG